MSKSFSIIVAIDSERGIGRAQDLPWKLKADMERFRILTTTCNDESKHNAVIMGRKTWESIPETFRPLKDRLNVVITRNNGYKLPAQVIKAASLDEALDLADSPQIENRFVIGGGEIYKHALEHQSLTAIFATEILDEFLCDTFFPEFENKFAVTETGDLIDEDGLEYRFKKYVPAEISQRTAPGLRSIE
jgi:dihydrofolate reductase